MTLEDFYSHCEFPDSGHIVFKNKAVEFLEREILEDFPFLRESITFVNPYRTGMAQLDFELFFLPALRYYGGIDD